MRRWAFLLCLLLPGGAFAEPALFVARAPGITAYLFGSVHVLPPGLRWESAALRTAYAEAGECWFEIEAPAGMAAAAPAVAALGLDPDHPLSRQLTPGDRRLLQARLNQAGMPNGMEAVDKMRPWMAYLFVSVLSTRREGMDPAKGADAVLMEQARTDGKRVFGLETIEQQVAVFADQKPAVVLRLLHQELSRTPKPRQWDRLVGAWMAGDLDTLARTADGMAGQFGTGLAEALLARRNAAWAVRLDGMRNSGKVILVTVGAGHLVGHDNLRDQLRHRQWTVERIQ